jgi:hypothetical protein
MTKDEALDLAREALEEGVDGQTSILMDKAITAIKQARSAPVQEPVAVKHMMGWVESLKRQSDYGQHMRIPGLNAGACFELALELEQFINTTPPAAQRQWVGLTDEEITELEETTTCLANESWLRNLTRAIEAKLKEKNT